MAHTPGPWKVIEEDHDISVDGEGWFDGQRVNGWVVVGNPDLSEFAVAVLDTGVIPYWDDQKLDANARLIAAAPDLLEAVQNLMGLFDTPVVRRRLKDDALYPEVINQARTAIARAKGE